MSKKTNWALAIATFFGAVFLFMTNALKVLHWNNIGWVCESYHPLAPVASWGGLGAMIMVFYFTTAKEHWYLKLVAALWFFINILLTYCIINTYWGF